MPARSPPPLFLQSVGDTKALPGSRVGVPPQPLPSYVVVNAGASVKLGRVESFVRVNDLFDTKYETFGTFAADGRQAGTPVRRFLTPAPPINVMMGAQYVF